MKHIQFKENAQKHLSEWIRTFHPDIKMGMYRNKQYEHILPLENYAKKDRKEAIIAAIRQYHVLTDNVELNTAVLPISELHTLANHLTSSQILCYNFFSLLLGNQMSDSRVIKISQDLRNWLIKSFPDILPVSEYAKCQFEFKFDDEEGTSLDFYVTDDTVTIMFEIKYTENGFGKAVNDMRHKEKFSSVYSELLIQQNTLRNDVPPEVFFRDYQLFRNTIRTNDQCYAVFIFPENNKPCSNQFNRFLSSEWIAQPCRIKSLTWENAFSNSVVTSHSELRQKYGF